MSDLIWVLTKLHGGLEFHRAYDRQGREVGEVFFVAGPLEDYCEYGAVIHAAPLAFRDDDAEPTHESVALGRNFGREPSRAKAAVETAYEAWRAQQPPSMAEVVGRSAVEQALAHKQEAEDLRGQNEALRVKAARLDLTLAVLRNSRNAHAEQLARDLADERRMRQGEARASDRLREALESRESELVAARLGLREGRRLLEWNRALVRKLRGRLGAHEVKPDAK